LEAGHVESGQRRLGGRGQERVGPELVFVRPVLKAEREPDVARGQADAVVREAALDRRLGDALGEHLLVLGLGRDGGHARRRELVGAERVEAGAARGVAAGRRVEQPLHGGALDVAGLVGDGVETAVGRVDLVGAVDLRHLAAEAPEQLPDVVRGLGEARPMSSGGSRS
jgi:hypothetical protein